MPVMLPTTCARGLQALAPMTALQGDTETAKQLLAESLALFTALGDEAGVAGVHGDLGIIVGWEDPARGAAHLEQSLAARRRLGDHAGAAIGLVNLATGAALAGDVQRAQALAAEALELGRVAGDTDTEAGALQTLALTAVDCGDREEAARHLADAFRLTLRLGYRDRVADSLVTAAALLAQTGAATLAARVLAAAETIRTGGAFEPLERDRHARTLDALSDQLPAEDLARARAAGRVTTLEEAVDLVLAHLAAG
jgi:hypothetical protein